MQDDGHNQPLRAERLKRGWSQQRVADELQLLFPDSNATDKDIGRWERGSRTPSPFYREKLCALYGKQADELGFIKAGSDPSEDESSPGKDREEPTRSQSSTKPNNGIQLFVPPKIEMMLPLHVRKRDMYGEPEPSDWGTWFGLKQMEMLNKINMWSGQPLSCNEVQETVNEEIQMLDEKLKQFDKQDELSISRRQVLVTIASLPVMLFNWRQPDTFNDLVAEEFLPTCAASLTTCWHLLRGSGLTAVEQIIPRYAPTLTRLVHSNNRYQKIAARLATQMNLLRAILAKHRMNDSTRERYCQEAIEYGRLSEDLRLHAVALMYLGYTYIFCEPLRPKKAIEVFRQALKVLEDESPLLTSDIYIGLADAYAQCHLENEALDSIRLAHECFPARPERDPSYLYADCSRATIFQWEGKMSLDLADSFPANDYYHKALTSFEQADLARPHSERASSEILIDQADAARGMGEQEAYTRYLYEGVRQAVDLGSQRRVNDAHSVFKRSPEKWQHEARIQNLAKSVFNQLLGGVSSL